MSTKAKVLEILEINRQKDVSGEQLAVTIGVSRAAINKVIKDLRQDGYIITAITNKGYRLSAQNDIISAEGIRAMLPEGCAPNIFVYSSLSSTNQTAKKLALDNAPDGSVIIANEQTAGRGRMGRSFFSPPDSGIYMSFILRPKINAQKGVLLTVFASVAVCRAIQKVFGINPKIKWVNDIIVNGKKVCGILTEAVTDFESGNVEYVILGIGVNFSTSAFPTELAGIACSLQTEKQSEAIRNKLIAEIITELSDYSDSLDNGKFIHEYKKLSCVLGKTIEIIHQSGKTTAEAVDVNDMGGLVVRLNDGSIYTLTSGEISIRGDFYSE